MDESLYYKGKDGREYSTPESLRRANEGYLRQKISYNRGGLKNYMTYEDTRGETTPIRVK